MEHQLVGGSLPVSPEYELGVRTVMNNICKQIEDDLPSLDLRQYVLLVTANSPAHVRGMLITRDQFYSRPIGNNHKVLSQDLLGITAEKQLPVIIVAPEFESLVVLLPLEQDAYEYHEGRSTDPDMREFSIEQLDSMNTAMDNMLRAYAKLPAPPPLDSVCVIANVGKVTVEAYLVERLKCDTKCLPQSVVDEIRTGGFDKHNAKGKMLTFVISLCTGSIGVYLFDFDPANLLVNSSGGEG